MSNPLGTNYLQQIRDCAKNTPDFLELRKKKEDEFLVFIYGAMKKSKPLHEIIRGANYYGLAVTTGDNYLIKKTAQNAPPILFEINNRWTKGGALITPFQMGKIEGEVYGVPLRALTKIDKVEDNGHSVHRVKRYVKFKEQPPTSPSIESVFIHLADRDFWEESVSNILALPGCTSVQSRGEKYFYYI